MGKVAVERLSVLKLSLLWNDNLILADREIGVVTIRRFDWANPFVLSNHVVNGRERKHFALLLDGMSYLVLFLEFLEEFWTGFLHVGLTFYIEHIVCLQLRIDVVLGTFLLRKLLVIIILDAFLGL